MDRCMICGKIMWFWQLVGFSKDKTEKLIHKKCYAEQSEDEEWCEICKRKLNECVCVGSDEE